MHLEHDIKGFIFNIRFLNIFIVSLNRICSFNGWVFGSVLFVCGVMWLKPDWRASKREWGGKEEEDHALGTCWHRAKSTQWVADWRVAGFFLYRYQSFSDTCFLSFCILKKFTWRALLPSFI